MHFQPRVKGEDLNDKEGDLGNRETRLLMRKKAKHGRVLRAIE
jgi:hypothetical protein